MLKHSFKNETYEDSEMNVKQNEMIIFDCTDCGNGQQLVINNERRGFFDTGWRADFSDSKQLAFICVTCATNWSENPLQKQKEYLKHIFEAQWRFGE